MKRLSVLAVLVILLGLAPVGAVAAPILFDNGSIPQPNSGGSAYTDWSPWRIYDDFSLPAGGTLGHVFFQTVVNGNGSFVNFDFAIFADSGGEPGGEIFSDTITPVDHTVSTPGNFGGFIIRDIEFDTLVNLGPGSYFVSFWGNPDSQLSIPQIQVGTGDGFEQGYVPDGTFIDRAGNTPFRFEAAVPEPSTLTLAGAGLLLLGLRGRRRRSAA